MSISNIDKTREEVEKIKKLADTMYYAAQQLTTDASRLHKAMDEYHKFIIHKCKEEPVSEDKFVSHEEIATMADKASKKCEVSIDKEFERLTVSEDLEKAAKENAKIERSDDTEVGYDINRFGGFVDGALWQKEQMMAKAVDTTVHIDAGNYPYIPQMELYDYDKDIPLAKEGDKYKVVLIKEE